MKYGGVYEAKVSGFGPNDEVLVLIPQVFGSAQVPVAAVLGDPPSANDKGVVAFISGEPEYPVWIGDGATSLQGIGAALESTQISVESAQAAADAAQSAADAAQADADTANIVANAAGSAASTAQSGVNALESNRLLLDGSNSPMTGQLSLVGDPTADAHAVRKAYVDTKYSVGLASARPTAASATGRLYYSTDTGRLEISDGSFWFLIEQYLPSVTPDVAWHEIGAGGEPAFENSWTNYNGSWVSAGYRMDEEGWVHLKGLIAAGGNGTTVFTLPSTHRPHPDLDTVLFGPALQYNNVGGYWRLYVDSGTLQPLGTNVSTWFNLSGIQFPGPDANVNERTRIYGFPVRDQSVYDEQRPVIFKRANGMCVLHGIGASKTATTDLPIPMGKFEPECASMLPVNGNSGTSTLGRFYVGSEATGNQLVDTTSNYTMFGGEYGTWDIADQWIEPSWSNGWGPYDNGTNDVWEKAGYYKDQYGFVHLRGLVGGGSSATAVMFNLPSGYRPAIQNMFPTNSASASNGVSMRVASNGDVYCGANGSTTWTSLFGVSFYADQ